ncbi:MAG: superoxide dismutase family protein [Hyphomicrobiaceae bacterium]|nr:MAG: superoxide dismutase family protein [Hyphomicrobiaceae bacterium]
MAKRRGLMAAAAAMGLLALSPPELKAAQTATAQMIGVDGKQLGTISLTETPSGVLILIQMKSIPPGPHGFHLMEAGKCEPPFKSAGNILNPLGAKHGLRSEEGPSMGDMPNLFAGQNGEINAELLNPFVTLQPDADGSLLRDSGTAFILRAEADDHATHPDGNSGARIACGVIKAGK